MVGAREIERRAREFCREALAFKRRRDFRVREDHVIGKTAVGKEGAKSFGLRFEALRVFVMDYGDLMEIHVHSSPFFAGFFIPEIAERPGRALIDLLDNAIGG